jgi:hypothetical protein
MLVSLAVASELAPLGTYTPRERGHWAFVKRATPTVPTFSTTADNEWSQNPIDAFILQQLRNEGLNHSPRAGRETLIRRVYFDMIGLPPSPREITEFLADKSPDAYQKIVEKLLASPQYGERWGQHWLDVVRFAETDGFEYDTHRRDAWRYRDYVIRAFNNDKPYDRFLTEQLAGDEIGAAPEDGDEALIAAGFNRLGPLRKNAGNQEVASSRNEVLTEMTNAVGAVMLGVTLGCARCHNHKFDPIRPKLLLNKLDGQKRPASFGEAKYQFVTGDAKLLGTKRTFKRYGKSGIEVSDLFPHLAQCVDDMAVIRSCHGDMVAHSAAQYQLFTGRVIPGFPSMGSWVIYGLGSESESLPAYVVLPDPKGAQEAGTPMYTNGFLPAVYQPTLFRPGDRPVLNLDLPKGVTIDQRRKTLGFLKNLNQLDMAPDDAEFSARLNAYDLAFKMQTEAPAIFALSKEPQETLEMYGIGKKQTDDFGRRCLLNRATQD